MKILLSIEKKNLRHQSSPGLAAYRRKRKARLARRPRSPRAAGGPRPMGPTRHEPGSVAARPGPSADSNSAECNPVSPRGLSVPRPAVPSPPPWLRPAHERSSHLAVGRGSPPVHGPCPRAPHSPTPSAAHDGHLPAPPRPSRHRLRTHVSSTPSDILVPYRWGNLRTHSSGSVAG